MYKFSKRSLKNLKESHELLQVLFHNVIKYYDCEVIEGHRGEEEQNKLFHAGRSKVKFPRSRHNASPSLAVDVCPKPIDWNDQKRWYYFGGFVKGMAAKMHIPIRWGGDWDGDNSFVDQNFHDLPHFELQLNKVEK